MSFKVSDSLDSLDKERLSEYKSFIFFEGEKPYLKLKLDQKTNDTDVIFPLFCQFFMWNSSHEFLIQQNLWLVKGNTATSFPRGHVTITVEEDLAPGLYPHSEVGAYYPYVKI